MEDIGKITTDLVFLKKPCERVETKEEGEEIARKLFRTLMSDNTYVGLAAPQISIPKCVCVINVKEPLYFINPKYDPVIESGKFVYLERCLSMPGVVVRTERWRQIMITADNLEGGSSIDISNIPNHLLTQSLDAFETVAIQHEIDHTFGILMTDRRYMPLPLKVGEMPGRNDKVQIWKGNEVIEIKYKKLDEFKLKGWALIE